MTFDHEAHEASPLDNIDGVISDLENADIVDEVAVATLKRVARQLQAAMKIIAAVPGSDMLIHAINETE
jgi:hypothetical protein